MSCFYFLRHFLFAERYIRFCGIWCRITGYLSTGYAASSSRTDTSTFHLSRSLAHNDLNRRHCPLLPHVPSQQSGSGPQYSGPTVKPLNATSSFPAPTRLSLFLSSLLSRLPPLPPTHTLFLLSIVFIFLNISAVPVAAIKTYGGILHLFLTSGRA